MSVTSKPEPLVAGLDIGTTSISAVLVAADGRVVASHSQPHQATVPAAAAGAAEQSPASLWQGAIRGLAAVADRGVGTRVRAIGVTGQMHSTVLLDERAEPVRNVITWQDRRSVSGPAPTPLERLRQALPEDLAHRTGCRPAAGYLGTTLHALRTLDDWPSECRQVNFVANWVAGRLSDSPGICDRSHAASSGLFDVLEDAWNAELVEAAGRVADLLPTVRPTGSVLGTLTADTAAATGIAATAVVCNGIGDNQASVLSALPDELGAALINIGTGGQLVWRTATPVRVPGLELRPLPADADAPGDIREAAMAVGAGLVGGDAIAWWNHTVQRWLQAFGVERSAESIWEQVQQRPPDADGTDGLRCVPVFRGTRLEPHRRAVIEQIGWDNLTPAALLHAIYDGIAELMQTVWRSVPEHAGADPRSIRMSGNASRRNPGLVAAVERRFRRPVSVCGFPEEAAVGAAMIAGVRCGIWPRIETARRVIQNAGT